MGQRVQPKPRAVIAVSKPSFVSESLLLFYITATFAREDVFRLLIEEARGGDTCPG